MVRANLGPSAAPDMREVVLSQSTWDRVGRPAAGRLSDLARRLTPAGLMATLEQRRELAGVDAKWTMERILAIKVVLGVVGLLAGLAVFMPDPTTMTFLVGAVFTAVGFYGPDLVLGRRAASARPRSSGSSPTRWTRSRSAWRPDSDSTPRSRTRPGSGTGPLAEELTRTLQDIQLGVARQTALEAMVERTDVSDIRHFVVAIGQANRYGVPVAQALQTQATEGRERRSHRAEERAQKMTVKLLFPLIFCILPALFVVLLGPAAIRIANMGLGG